MRQAIIPTMLAVFYLLAAVRYFPDQPRETLLATLTHLLQSLPLLAAVTYLVVLTVGRVTGQAPPWPGIARIFLLIALGYEFFFALYHHAGVV